MSQLVFTVLEIDEDIIVFGLRQKSNDKAQSKDIPSLSKKYHAVVEKGRGEVIPFFVVSKDYDENTRDFSLFIGGMLENENLETFTIPRGLFVKTTIKPKAGFLWGLLIGRAKRAFYTLYPSGLLGTRIPIKKICLKDMYAVSKTSMTI